MEKYSQYRDRGSGIAPFLPITTPPSGLHLPFHIFLFLFRLPIFLTVSLSYFLVLQWLPIGSLGKKAALWLILGVPGLWWVDLQIDGVKKGSLSQQDTERLPQPGSIIASSYTSPIDALYLSAIFDPIFTASYPTTRQVERLNLFQAILRTFLRPQLVPSPKAKLTSLPVLLKQNPNHSIVVFPECVTTNGRGILQFSPSLLTTPSSVKIFPVSIRYTAADITTPIPNSYLTFLWNFLSKPTHCIRVRIAESINNIATPSAVSGLAQEERASSSDTLLGSEEGEELTPTEKRLLDRVATALARLGKSKKLGLSVRDKIGFINAYSKR